MSPGGGGAGSKGPHPSSSYKSVPVLIGTETSAIKQIPADATRIECGSYTSANSYSIDQLPEQPMIGGFVGVPNGDLEAHIADACKDISSDDDEEKKRKMASAERAGPKNNDDIIEEFFDTESSAPFARNGSAGKATSAKKKKTPPASAPLPAMPSASSAPSKSSKRTNGSRREKSNDSDDFSCFDMEDI
ncbi:unnamed protein product [Caenorhabditis sp. 36 PRJEB53466]|nr:unnamed protein product [Caenorhabditis sp. 36 PRJEB53466]